MNDALNRIANSLESIATLLCERRPKSLKASTQATSDAINDALAEYITERSTLFTRYCQSDPRWIISKVHGDCAGRYTQAVDKSWTLTVPTACFGLFTRERGIDRRQLKRWTSERKVQKTTGILVALGTPVKVYVIPNEAPKDMSDSQQVKKGDE